MDMASGGGPGDARPSGGARGPGSHGFYCQFKHRVDYVTRDRSYILPARAWSEVSSLVRHGGYVITALVEQRGGPAYELSHFDDDDVAELQSGEAQGGVQFAG